MFAISTFRPTFRCAAALALAALVLTACRGPQRGSGRRSISLFTDHVSIYEVHNDGNWYDFGVMIGVSAVFSGPASTRAAARRPRPDRRAKS